MDSRRKTATYKIVSEEGGNRYQFFCDLSESLICTTKPIKADSPDEELMLAWESEGRAYFNQCRKCGKWIIDAMYNPDVLNCVDCSPLESEPRFCKKCGTRVTDNSIFCHICGKRLLYGGETEVEEPQ